MSIVVHSPVPAIIDVEDPPLASTQSSCVTTYFIARNEMTKSSATFLVPYMHVNAKGMSSPATQHSVYTNTHSLAIYKLQEAK